VAEAFSINLGLKYFLSCEIEPPLCVVWNGQLNSLSNKLVPKCAPQGKADIEVYTPDGAWVVDATLAGDTGVQLAEARRLKRHNPTLTSNIAHDWQNIQGFWLVFNLFLALGSVFLL